MSWRGVEGFEGDEILIFNFLSSLLFHRYIGYSHKLAVLLDYDGTLAPIAPHPDLATLPPETRNILQRLSNIPEVHVFFTHILFRRAQAIYVSCFVG